jgi:hypothetical protein
MRAVTEQLAIVLGFGSSCEADLLITDLLAALRQIGSLPEGAAD